MITHYFHSQVWQPETLTEVSIPSCKDLFPIKFQLFEVTRSYSGTWTEEEDENVTSKELEEEKLVAERQTEPLSRGQLLYLRCSETWSICTDALTSMGVPHDEQPAVVANILETLKVAIPFRPIFVVIKDMVTVEGKEECVHCHEGIPDFGHKSVTRLPCRHIFNTDCYRKWQEKSCGHLGSCSMCRYPMSPQRVQLSTFSRSPEHQYIYEDNVDDVDLLPKSSWRGVGLMKVFGRTLRTLSSAPL